MEAWTEAQRQAFGARLATARGRLSQAEVGAMFDISKQAVSHWEKGRNLPTIEQVALMAQEFRVSVDWLLTGEHREWPFGDHISPAAVAQLSHDELMQAVGMLRLLIQQAAPLHSKPQRPAA